MAEIRRGRPLGSLRAPALAFLLAALSPALGAFAQEGEPEAVRALVGCLAQGGDGARCLAPAAAACPAGPEAEASACLVRAAALYEGAARSFYRDAEAALETEDKRRLRAAQVRVEDAKRAVCEVEGAAERGGSARLAEARCRARKDGERLLELRDLAGRLTGRPGGR